MNMRCVSARWRRWGAALGVVGLAASLGLLPSAPAMAKKRAPEQYSPPYAAIVVDVKTGKTLHAVNADAPRIPASITKVMTLYLLFEQLEGAYVHADDHRNSKRMSLDACYFQRPRARDQCCPLQHCHTDPGCCQKRALLLSHKVHVQDDSYCYN